MAFTVLGHKAEVRTGRATWRRGSASLWTITQLLTTYLESYFCLVEENVVLSFLSLTVKPNTYWLARTEALAVRTLKRSGSESNQWERRKNNILLTYHPWKSEVLFMAHEGEVLYSAFYRWLKGQPWRTRVRLLDLNCTVSSVRGRGCVLWRGWSWEPGTKLIWFISLDFFDLNSQILSQKSLLNRKQCLAS